MVQLIVYQCRDNTKFPLIPLRQFRCHTEDRDARRQQHVFTLATKNRLKMFDGLPCFQDKHVHGIGHKRQAQAGILHCG